MSQKLGGTLNRKTKGFLSDVLATVLLPFLLISCAGKPSLKPESPPSSSANPDADTDAVLGVLPEEGQTEAEKQAEGLEEEDESEKALAELRQREREEEERRTHRNVTDDRIFADLT